jgi:CysZ protein
LWTLFIVSFFLFFVYTFVTIANIVAAPFNSFLAEKVEMHLTGRIPEYRSLLDNIKDVPRIIGRQFAILGYYLPRAFGILILFFIPVLHLIAPFLWVVFNAWYLALTYVDYPTDNHRIPVAIVRERLHKKRWLAIGFGGSVLAASMVPIVNLFTIPAAVAGATKLWCQTAPDDTF